MHNGSNGQAQILVAAVELGEPELPSRTNQSASRRLVAQTAAAYQVQCLVFSISFCVSVS